MNETDEQGDGDQCKKFTSEECTERSDCTPNSVVVTMEQAGLTETSWQSSTMVNGFHDLTPEQGLESETTSRDLSTMKDIGQEEPANSSADPKKLKSIDRDFFKRIKSIPEETNLSDEEGKGTIPTPQKAKEVKDLLLVLEKAVRGAAFFQKEKEEKKEAAKKKRKNQSSKLSPVTETDPDCKDTAKKEVIMTKLNESNNSNGLEDLMTIASASECDPNLVICGSEINVSLCLMEMIDQHRNPVVHEEIDYGDAWLQEEIHILKEEAGMTESSVILETEPSTSKEQEHGLKKCPVCNKDSTLACKNCLNVSYCCREHQKEHWKSHRPLCVLYEVAENEILGRHLIAKTNIKVGDLILREFPFLVGPTGPDSVLEHLKFDASKITDEPLDVGKYSKEDILENHSELFFPVCLGCNLHLGETSMPAFCSECGWPMCNMHCLSYSNHSLECKYFKEENISFKEVTDEHLIPPRLFFILKALLLAKEKPFVWDKLMKLQSHIEERKTIEKAYGRRLNDLYIAFLLKTTFKLTDIPLQIIDVIFGIMDTNAFYSAHNVPDIDNAKCPAATKSRKQACLYEKGSLLAHACLPNAIAVRLYPPSLEVIAALPIKKGDIIFISYDHQEAIRPKHERRQLLGLQYCLNCNCRICEDPTEGGLLLSAVTCLRCRRRGLEGYFVPENANLEEPTWKCIKCGLVKTDSVISKVVRDVSHQLYECVETVRVVVEKCSGHILHKNNWMILQAEFDTIRLLYAHLSQHPTTFPISDIIYLVSVMEKRIEIMTKLVPPCHKSLVNLKVQLVEILRIQAEMSMDEAIPSISYKVQAIYDDVARLLTEHSVRNSLQGFLLKCNRLIRETLRNLHEHNRQRQLKNKSKISVVEVDEMKVEAKVEPI